MKDKNMLFLIFTLFSSSMAASSNWVPVAAPHSNDGRILQQESSIYREESSTLHITLDTVSSAHPLAQQEQDQCALYKVAMNQQLYFEVSYKCVFRRDSHCLGVRQISELLYSMSRS